MSLRQLNDYYLFFKFTLVFYQSKFKELAELSLAQRAILASISFTKLFYQSEAICCLNDLAKQALEGVFAFLNFWCFFWWKLAAIHCVHCE